MPAAQQLALKPAMPTYIKFGISEKHTKFEEIFVMVLTNQLIYLGNVKAMRKIFFSNYVCFSKSPNFTTPTPWLTLILVLGKSRVKQNSC